MPRRDLTPEELEQIENDVVAKIPDGLTDEEFERVFAPRMEMALGTAENSPAPLQGSATRRFLANAAEVLNPVAAVKGIYSAVTDIPGTIENIAAASMDQGRQAKQAAGEGRYFEAGGHALGMIPVIGPAAAQAGEQIASGDVAGGLGRGTGLVAPVVAASAVRTAGKAAGVIPKSSREVIAERLKAIANEKIEDVIAPKVGANKVRFGNMAEDVAPAIAKEAGLGGWSREALHRGIGEKLQQAEAALDEAANTRLNARTIPTSPIIADLMAKRARLTAEAVEGSQLKPKVSNLTPAGEETVLTTKTGVPLGKDVVPGPNAARVAVIDKAIAELKELGPVARYEPLRRIREAYDGPAKVKYNPSVTQDFMKVSTEAAGAADVTGSLRETLARFDPVTAKANADYSLWRKANDVLEATAEIERTRPKVGRQIMTRLTTTMAGQQAAGVPGAVGGFVLGPVLDAALNAGVTSKIQTAKLLTQMADAIRRGDLGHVTSLQYRLKNAVAQAGTLTSPSESRSQTTVPAGATP